MTHVLFVCLGNSCRSQMAEAFARTYGSDVMTARSAGLAPAAYISPLTRTVMAEKNISLDDHFPKSLGEVEAGRFDLIVNMSGLSLPGSCGVPVRVWKIRDPMGAGEDVFRAVRDELEMRVMDLILELRRPRKRTSAS